MFSPDPTQRAVLGLDPARHARVLGAPGSGKTTVLVEAFARSELAENEVLAFAPNRLSAKRLRVRIEERLQRALGGTVARTPVSFAFAVLSTAAAAAGDPAPRLLTGTVQDETISEAIETRLARGAGSGYLAPEVLRSEVFRAEVREFWRVLDDFGLEAADLAARIDAVAGHARSEALTDAPDDSLLERWSEALRVVAEVAERLVAERSGELSSSALLRAAGDAIRAEQVSAPALILVDDAQELGEGQLALLAACAAAGSTVWVFGDPDTATESFHGERTRVLSGLTAELERRGAPAEPEQQVVLEHVHRHGAELRGFVRELTARIGAAGPVPQRAALAASERRDLITCATAESQAEQLGMIAHRLRSRHLGIGDEVPMPWRQMAVLCRSRDEAMRVSRVLASHQVPTAVAAGGIVLREHRVVRDLIRLLQRARAVAQADAPGDRSGGEASSPGVTAREVQDLLSGPLGGLDPVAVRRLRGALMMQERRESAEEQRDARDTDDLVVEAFLFPGATPAVDSPAGRALRRLGRIAAAGVTDQLNGGTPRESLWAVWDATKLADTWQADALAGRGVRASEADRSLDAVMGLFYALQRHEEQDNSRPVEDLLRELLENAVPEDTLAQRAQRDVVTVTTPQGTVGMEFDLVAVFGPQDGVWPNARARGSLLGTVALERWLRGAQATEASRLETIHDELRLFAQACSRAAKELLVVAVSDEDQHPSPFFRFGRDHLEIGLPSSRLTLRGATAEMRRRVTIDPSDQEAIDSLVALAQAGAAGAAPSDWYGVLPPSTLNPLYALDPSLSSGDAHLEGRGPGEAGATQRVPVSPSQLEKAENCPLDWVVSMLGGGSSNVRMNLGTLLHHAFETAETADAEAMLATVEQGWGRLAFDAEWQSEHARAKAVAMVQGLADYLREFESSDRELVGRESGFRIPLGPAELRGLADRLEARTTEAGTEVTVVDLKTGATAPTGPAIQTHAQLQAYQLGVSLGAFSVGGRPLENVASGGAKLLFVDPNVAKKSGFVERAQQPLSDEARAAFIERVESIAHTMAAATFEARVDHHCADPYSHGDCRLHIIEAVSHS